jgi:hypothetical protein
MFLSLFVIDTHALLMQARIGEAEGLKQAGNELFRRGKWDEALQTYRNGLAQLPKRRNPPPPPPPASDEIPPPEGDADRIPTDAQNQHESTVPSDADTPLEHECAKARSVLNANIAACHVKLASTHARDFRTEPRLTAFLCRVKPRMPLKRARKVRHAPLRTLTHHPSAHSALQDDPSYVRALQRRAQCNEKIGSWSALSSVKEGIQISARF